MSPEIVSKSDYWGPAADVWACGVILFIMLTGNLPFKSQNEKELFRKIQKGVYVLACPQTNNTISSANQQKL